MNDLLTERRHGVSAAPKQASQQGDAWLSQFDLLRTEIEALRRQNQALRETLDTIDGTVVAYDAQRNYLFGNQRYHALYPHLPSESELIGRKYEDLLTLSIAVGAVDRPERTLIPPTSSRSACATWTSGAHSHPRRKMPGLGGRACTRRPAAGLRSAPAGRQAAMTYRCGWISRRKRRCSTSCRRPEPRRKKPAG